MRQSLCRLLRGACLGFLVLAAAPGARATSLSGAYLAAMQADFRNDYVASAEYLDRALAIDPQNVGLMQNSIVAHVAAGDVAGATGIADRLEEAMPGNQIAVVVQVSDAIAKEDFAVARDLLDEAGPSVTPLLAGLLSGWVEVGMGDFSAAQERFDLLKGNAALEAYGQYHKALALALAGDFLSAATILANGEDGPLHVNLGALVAHAQVLVQIDRDGEALEILDEALAGGIPNAVLLDLRDRIAAGENVAFTRVTNARSGAAEALLTLADALSSSESERIGLMHAQLAAYVDPGAVEARLLAADILEREEQFDLASQALAGVPPESPWYMTAEIRRASTQSAAGDTDGGIATLTDLAAAYPEQIEVQSALGDALRVAERYGEAAEAYDAAIALVPDPQPVHWVLYYTRGISNERAGNWPAAEADFREALVLSPDQPMVLNYLGYSLVEQGRDLDEALDMIERAVAGQPDDGYITDSLGWVLYRMGRYEEAVPHMLRAVELTPDDPIINDHLGDVLWKVGRIREAEFQWRRALSFGPAPDLDMDRVRRKLEVGLDQVISEAGPGTDG